MSAPKVPLDDAKPLIWSLSIPGQPNFVLVACRVIRKLWADYRPTSGVTTSLCYIPTDNPRSCIVMMAELKSRRCTVYKSDYTITIRWGNGNIVARCDEEKVRIHVDTESRWMNGRVFAENIVNCFEKPEVVWDCLRGVLQICPFDPFTESAEKWMEEPWTIGTCEGGFYCRVSQERQDKLVEIDTTSGAPMPDWFKAIEMNAERMEPFHIYQAPVLPNTDRMYTIGSATKL